MTRVAPCNTVQLPVRSKYRAKELLSHAQEVDYPSIIGDSRIVFLGESHHDALIRKEVIELAPQLKELGFTHLAMEIFHSASRELWEYYEQYDRDNYTREMIVGQEMVWHQRTKQLDDFNWGPPKRDIFYPYLGIADTALDNGLEVLGIEWCRYDGRAIIVHQEKNFPEMGLPLEFLRSLIAENDRQPSVMSELYYGIFHQHLPVRNWHGAKVLSRELEDPGARIAVLGGRKHVGRLLEPRNNYSLPTLLEKFSGVTGPSVYFSTEGVSEERPIYRASPNIVGAVHDAAADILPAQQRFMLRMAQSSEEEIDFPDFIVHLPS